LGSSPDAVNILFSFALFFNQLQMARELQCLAVRIEVEWFEQIMTKETE
jgi:hypothetical protein